MSSDIVGLDGGLGWTEEANRTISPAALLGNAAQTYNQFLTQAGRALTKHPEVAGLTPESYKNALRSDAAINKAGEDAMASMISQGTRSLIERGRFGSVIQYQLPNGFGAKFYGPGSQNPGQFIGFKGP